MKIEKLNDHQIRCTLTKEDLAMRQINLSELAYGTEKTKELFQDMMTQASIDFGFEAEDIPIMVEAIPLSPEQIVLIITKVDSPEELDTRFSNFTNWDESRDADQDSPADVLPKPDSLPSELVDLLHHLKQDQPQTEGVKPEKKEEPAVRPSDMVRMFLFDHMEDAIQAACALKGLPIGDNTLYKDPGTSQYLLILHRDIKHPAEYNRIVHCLSSYLTQQKCSTSMEAHCEEHCKVILRHQALQTLAEI